MALVVRCEKHETPCNQIDSDQDRSPPGLKFRGSKLKRRYEQRDEKKNKAHAEKRARPIGTRRDGMWIHLDVRSKEALKNLPHVMHNRLREG